MNDSRIIYNIKILGGNDYIQKITEKNKQKYLKEKYNLGSLTKAQQVITIFQYNNHILLNKIICEEETISSVFKRIKKTKEFSKKHFSVQFFEILSRTLENDYRNQKYPCTGLYDEHEQLGKYKFLLHLTKELYNRNIITRDQVKDILKCMKTNDYLVFNNLSLNKKTICFNNEKLIIDDL